MFKNYESQYHQVNGIKIHCRVGGSGPGLLLLHGHPQTHVIWHKIAEDLAQHFTVVAADLRGYGDSDKPPVSDNSENYSKRVMAQDQLELMASMGFDKFSVLAHDRGARVAHRLAVDHSGAVNRMILLDVAPTLAMYEKTNQEFARAYWHWFFLIRPAPIPEFLITSDPEQYLRNVMLGRSIGDSPFTDEAFAEYVRCVSLPGSATGICEDYRASAGIDLEHDREDIATGRKLECPLLVRWGKGGAIERCFDPISEWKKVATNISGSAVMSGHYIPEEVPKDVLQDVRNFLR